MPFFAFKKAQPNHSGARSSTPATSAIAPAFTMPATRATATPDLWDWTFGLDSPSTTITRGIVQPTPTATSDFWDGFWSSLLAPTQTTTTNSSTTSATTTSLPGGLDDDSKFLIIFLSVILGILMLCGLIVGLLWMWKAGFKRRSERKERKWNRDWERVNGSPPVENLEAVIAQPHPPRLVARPALLCAGTWDRRTNERERDAVLAARHGRQVNDEGREAAITQPQRARLAAGLNWRFVIPWDYGNDEAREVVVVCRAGGIFPRRASWTPSLSGYQGPGEQGLGPGEEGREQGEESQVPDDEASLQVIEGIEFEVYSDSED